MRALWVTRFDWTTYGQKANSARIDEIVHQAALAGFNVIFFQVRGAADAYYASELEPWAQRVSGKKLGDPPQPFWDPLAYIVERAHAAGIQVHAYLNVYPVAEGGSFCGVEPGADVTPKLLYHLLKAKYGETTGKPNALQWLSNGAVYCSEYQLASPASKLGEDHVLAVVVDLVRRYDIDGIHLDRIRYGARNTSCDPVSLCSYHSRGEVCDPVPACNLSVDYKEWQRQQVNRLVRRLYEEVTPLKPNLLLTAAVWPIYIKRARARTTGLPLARLSRPVSRFQGVGRWQLHRRYRADLRLGPYAVPATLPQPIR